ncbi:MAG: NAD-dependent epimerase/dehydratase family protein [Bacteroidetes bacterium]|nr:NAD-dependent epimerase/dehydratase family protein [Bacteroidota bacterium]
MGTANSFGPGTKEHPGVETNAYSGDQYQTDYMDSKYEAYLAVKKAVKDKGLNAITVHPTFMIGPYDTKPSSGAMILAVYNGKVPGYTKGGRNYIYVKDVAEAAVNGLTMGQSGESYILGNENLSYKEAFSTIAKAVGVKAPSRYFPPALVLTYGKIGDWIYALTKILPTVSYPMARISCDEHYYSSAKAVKELNLKQTPIASILPQAFEWLKKFHLKK